MIWRPSLRVLARKRPWRASRRRLIQRLIQEEIS